jgi:predicted ATPase
MPEYSIQGTFSIINPIEWIEIEGFRGFAEKVHLNLAEPNGKIGSGMTIIVGPNNSGKSTIIESLHVLSGTQAISFNEFMTNKKTDHKIDITIKYKNGNMKRLKTQEDGGSETEWEIAGDKVTPSRIFVLPSRRRFNPLLKSQAKNEKEERLKYISNTPFSGNRGEEMDRFQTHIFKWQDNKKHFNEEIKKILDPLPEWKINNYPTGANYLEIYKGETRHNSEGLGDGILNVLMIVDAFYDSSPKETIVIDEPELSLHPYLQKRLIYFLAEYAKDRKIVIATHSPYFINFDYLLNGAILVRTAKENNIS